MNVNVSIVNSTSAGFPIGFPASTLISVTGGWSGTEFTLLIEGGNFTSSNMTDAACLLQLSAEWAGFNFTITNALLLNVAALQMDNSTVLRNGTLAVVGCIYTATENFLRGATTDVAAATWWGGQTAHIADSYISSTWQCNSRH